MARKTCPACAEKIDLKAIKCRYCGHEMTDEEMAAASAKAKGNRIGCWFIVLALLTLFIAQCASSDRSPTYSPDSTAAPQQAESILRKELQIDRFTWEASGDTYCRADAKFTNSGDVTLSFVRVTLQFLVNGELVGSDTSYLDVRDLAPGASSTYDAMYECPGQRAKVDITAVSDGDAVSIVDAPKKGR